jgi:hypothetical protein
MWDLTIHKDEISDVRGDVDEAVPSCQAAALRIVEC